MDDGSDVTSRMGGSSVERHKSRQPSVAVSTKMDTFVSIGDTSRQRDADDTKGASQGGQRELEPALDAEKTCGSAGMQGGERKAPPSTETGTTTLVEDDIKIVSVSSDQTLPKVGGAVAVGKREDAAPEAVTSKDAQEKAVAPARVGSAQCIGVDYPAHRSAQRVSGLYLPVQRQQGTTTTATPVGSGATRVGHTASVTGNCGKEATEYDRVGDEGEVIAGRVEQKRQGDGGERQQDPGLLVEEDDDIPYLSRSTSLSYASEEEEGDKEPYPQTNEGSSSFFVRSSAPSWVVDSIDDDDNDEKEKVGVAVSTGVSDMLDSEKTTRPRKAKVSSTTTAAGCDADDGPRASAHRRPEPSSSVSSLDEFLLRMGGMHVDTSWRECTAKIASGTRRGPAGRTLPTVEGFGGYPSAGEEHGLSKFAAPARDSTADLMALTARSSTGSVPCPSSMDGNPSDGRPSTSEANETAATGALSTAEGCYMQAKPTNVSNGAKQVVMVDNPAAFPSTDGTAQSLEKLSTRVQILVSAPTPPPDSDSTTTQVVDTATTAAKTPVKMHHNPRVTAEAESASNARPSKSGAAEPLTASRPRSVPTSTKEPPTNKTEEELDESGARVLDHIEEARSGPLAIGKSTRTHRRGGSSGHSDAVLLAGLERQGGKKKTVCTLSSPETIAAAEEIGKSRVTSDQFSRERERKGDQEEEEEAFMVQGRGNGTGSRRPLGPVRRSNEDQLPRNFQPS